MSSFWHALRWSLAFGGKAIFDGACNIYYKDPEIGEGGDLSPVTLMNLWVLLDLAMLLVTAYHAVDLSLLGLLLRKTPVAVDLVELRYVHQRIASHLTDVIAAVRVEANVVEMGADVGHDNLSTPHPVIFTLRHQAVHDVVMRVSRCTANIRLRVNVTVYLSGGLKNTGLRLTAVTS